MFYGIKTKNLKSFLQGAVELWQKCQRNFLIKEFLNQIKGMSIKRYVIEGGYL